MDGGTYSGLVDRYKRPNGLGKEYYPPYNLKKVRYYGYYLNGKKHGNGTLYDIDGEVYYVGEFHNGNPIGNVSIQGLQERNSTKQERLKSENDT